MDIHRHGACYLALALVLSPLLRGDERLHVVVRESYLPDVPLLLRVEVRDDETGSIALRLWDGEARVSARGPGASVTPSRVRLRNGAGSALLKVEGDGAVDLVVALDGLEATARLRHGGDDTVRTVSGRLPSGLTEWDGVVRVAADVEVPANATLRVLPGALVLVDGVSGGDDGVDIDVRGRIEIAGSAARPVSLTASEADRAWGEIDLRPGAEAVMSFLHVTRGGHSPSLPIALGGPVLRLESASLVADAIAITDQAGQGIYALASRVELRDSLLARCVLGIQAEGADVFLERCRLEEMAGETDEDDNDFVHLRGASGSEEVLLAGCVFASGTDDAVDLHEIDGVEIEDCIFRDLGDKGISFFHEELFIRRCLFADNEIAISTKAGDSALTRVHVDRSTFVDNLVAIEARDKFDVPEARIRYDIVSSILWSRDGAGARLVRTDYDPSFIAIRYSDLSEEWDDGGSRDNISADPRFIDRAGHDYRLQPDSPCIDRGDPATSDPDGSRADQGAFPFTPAREVESEPFVRGNANAHPGVDIADPVLVLFHLAFGAPLACLDAADADDSGRLDLSDALWILNFLFLGGERPPPPFSACGNDPTSDTLGCERYAEC